MQLCELSKISSDTFVTPEPKSSEEKKIDLRYMFDLCATGIGSVPCDRYSCH